jgi:pilin isopeptide linkage protein
MKWLAAIGMIMILLLTVCAATAEGVSETLQVSISTKGTPPETPETYTVRLTADGDFPMPEGYQTGADGKYSDLTITGAASKSFPTIAYERPGIYTYTVKQIPGKAEGVTYDNSVYNVKVQVYNNEAKTGFEIVTAIRKQGSTGKTPIRFVNVYPVELISKTVTKNWDDNDNQDGIRPDELTATLTSSDGMTPVPVTLNAENNWTVTVEKLPRFKEDTRDEIIYTWTEGKYPDPYSYVSTVTAENVTTITNRHVPYTTEASVEKIWDDANNQDGIRPKGESVVRVTLLADGAEKQKVYLSEANGWKATVTGLPKNEKGKEIKYTWKEDSTTVGYELTGNATSGQLTTLVNTHVTEKTTATIVKNWVDGDNQDGLRPESIEVTLSNGTPVTLNADNNWRATVENLPKFENGKEIVYTWKEGQMPAGYTLTDNSADGTITTITNTHTPETKEVKIQKVWVDEEDKDGLRQPVTLVLPPFIPCTSPGSGIRVTSMDPADAGIDL